jgi:hypothetical protein
VEPRIKGPRSGAVGGPFGMVRPARCQEAAGLETVETGRGHVRRELLTTGEGEASG